MVWRKRRTDNMESRRTKHRGEYREREEENPFNRGGTQTGPRRDLNAMDIDKGRGGDKMCYVCGKWDHIAKNCWKRHKGRVVEML